MIDPVWFEKNFPPGAGTAALKTLYYPERHPAEDSTRDEMLLAEVIARYEGSREGIKGSGIAPCNEVPCVWCACGAALSMSRSLHRGYSGYEQDHLDEPDEFAAGDAFDAYVANEES